MAYSGLPGIQTRLQDGGLKTVQNFEATQSVLLLVAANSDNDDNTQLYEPQFISTETQFTDAGFGTLAYTNLIYAAWKECINAGCKDIRVLEIMGLHTDASPETEDCYTNLHEVYRQLEDFDIDVVALVGVYQDSTIPLPPTFPAGEVMDYCAEGETEADIADETPTGTIDSANTTFTFANDFVKEGTLTVTVDTVVIPSTGYTMDWIVGEIDLTVAPDTTCVVDYTYYAATRDFAAQMRGFCTVVSDRVSQTLGVISMTPNDTITLAGVKAYVTALSSKVYHGLVQILAGPRGIYKDTDGTAYASDNVGGYAGLITTLPAYSSTTNKAILGCYGVDYVMSPAQLAVVSGYNLVSLRLKNGRIVVTDGVTTAGTTSDYTRLTTMRIVNDAVQGARTVAEPFIGEPNDVIHRNALDTAIRNHLKGMVSFGALTTFTLAINATKAQMISGNLYVTIVLVPKFETRVITINVSLKPSLD